jgi:SAM-dependent methyltransferase
MPRPDATRFFAHYAADFDALYGGGRTPWSRFINRRLRASMRLRFEATLASCEPLDGKCILDVGCGPGHYLAALARGGARRVVGLDSAAPMIELSRARCGRTGVAHRCEFICTRFEHFRSEESFDHVICMGFLEYDEQPAKTIAAILRRTRGSALFSLPDCKGWLAWQRRQRYRFRTRLRMYSEAEVRTLFGGIPEVAGFDVRRLQRDFFVTARPGPASGSSGQPRA